MTVTTSKVAVSVPKQIIQPIEGQSVLSENIRGSTPTAVVADVRKIGIIRRWPASMAACLAMNPLRCSSSA